MKLGNPEDLTRAISLQEIDIQNTPATDRVLCAKFFELGKSFACRFDKFSDKNDYTSADKCLSTAVQNSSATSWERLGVAANWANWRFHTNPSTAIEAYTAAIQICPTIINFGLNIADQHSRVQLIVIVIRDGVFTALKYGYLELATVWLDQGHSVIWNRILQMRTPLEALYLEYPQYCRRLKEISHQLESVPTYQDITPRIVQGRVKYSSDKLSLYQALAFEREELITTIRTLPKFSDFMGSITFEEIQRIIRSEGPLVMINLSQKGCDALIVSLNEIDHLSLLQFTWKKAEDSVTSLTNLLHHMKIDQRATRGVGLIYSTALNPDVIFKDILSQLWNDVAKPILNHLGITVSHFI